MHLKFINTRYGSIMQAMRERSGLSQEQLADEVHISRSCVSKFENDKKIPDMPTMIAWAQATGATEVVVAFICGLDGLSIMQQVLGLLGS